MTQNSETPSTNLRAIGQIFTLTGWISFWIQLVLGVVSGVILLLYGISSQKPGSSGNNPGTGFGIFLAICGIVGLGVGIYMSFRYTRIGNALQSSNASNRPRKSETLQVLRLGSYVSLAGILATLLGAQAIVGTLAARAITQTQLLLSTQGNQGFITGLDMFVVQANINTISAHFAGLVAALWLMNRINR